MKNNAEHTRSACRKKYLGSGNRNRLPKLILMICVPVFLACSKSGSGGGGGPVIPIDTPVVIKPQVDPAINPTMGFFLDNWLPKTFARPGSTTPGAVTGAANSTIAIDRSEVLTKVPQSLYGNNTNTWMTQIVTEPNLMKQLNILQPKILRFPGGSISDVFFWNAEKNQKPADIPASLINADGSAYNNYWWCGKNADSWTFSVDNYYNLLSQLGSTGIITINYGYARYGLANDPVAAAAHLAADWVRYDNGRTRYWEIGNENFGNWEAGYRINTTTNKDGQTQYASGDLYGRHFKVFADSMKKAAASIGKTIYVGAVMSESVPLSWWDNTARFWNSGLFSTAGNTPDFFVVHNYYTDYKTNDGAATILTTAPAVTATMMQFVKQQLASGSIAAKPIVLDEYNITSEGSKQQVSHINGMHAAMVLGEALHNGFGLTARWDLANGWSNGNDHGMFNIGDEPDGVPKWNPRPAFYHMLFFEKFMGDRMVRSSSTDAEIRSYASSFSSGEMGVVMVNTGAATKIAEVKISNFLMGNSYWWYTITGDTDNGTFSRKVIINGKKSNYAAGGPDNPTAIEAYTSGTGNGIKVSLPPYSAVYLAVDKK